MRLNCTLENLSLVLEDKSMLDNCLEAYSFHNDNSQNYLHQCFAIHIVIPLPVSSTKKYFKRILQHFCQVATIFIV